MSTGQLHIGTQADGKPFTLPADLGDKKIAVLAQSKKGKTYGLGDILEELAKAQRPFIATDPANNLWGLRVRPDGTPSGLKVVVIGGDHADIPFEKEQGERMAEALLATPICAVIDVAFESLGSIRRFMTDFAGRLMQSKPEIPRVIVLEEAPVLIPQKARGPAMEVCKAAVSKLATIGGNFGYGVIPASQRAATIDKDVLSQCEALIVMGMTHSADRHTVMEWMLAKGIEEQVATCFRELGSLKPGEAWYWNPGEDIFQKFTFRKRETLHPREMQKLGLKASAVQLGDMQTFVEKVRKELTKTQVAVHIQGDLPKNPKTRAALMGMVKLAAEAPPARQLHDHSGQILTLQRDLELAQESVSRLQEELNVERGIRAGAEERVAICRNLLKPQWDVLKRLFEEISVDAPAGRVVDRTVWEPWLLKAGRRGCKRMLEVLIEKGELTRNQLGTLSNVASTKSTFRNYLSWLRSNGLVETDGEKIRLRAV